MANKPNAQTKKPSTSRVRRDAHAIFIDTVRSISGASNSRDMLIQAQHVQSLVALQAATLISAAIDRNTAAIKALAKVNPH